MTNQCCVVDTRHCMVSIKNEVSIPAANKFEQTSYLIAHAELDVHYYLFHSHHYSKIKKQLSHITCDVFKKCISYRITPRRK